MPPKAARPLNEEDIKFLGVAFKHLKEKPQVDFKSLAEELAMSAGGARFVTHLEAFLGPNVRSNLVQ